MASTHQFPPRQPNRLRNTISTLAGLGILFMLLSYVPDSATKLTGALTLFAIWGIATVSLNLINGTLGILSLGHHGFMLIGGYVTALLVLPQDKRDSIMESGRSAMNDTTINLSVAKFFDAVGLDALASADFLWLHFVVALFFGGVMAAIFGLIVGFPSLRLRGDYLAIVTFGFGEIIRLLASTSTVAPITNGALGFNGVPGAFGKSLWWTFGILAFTVFVISKLKFSSFGRAMEGIREDPIAAQAMGVNLAYHKVLGFAISAFFAGVAGGLWVSWLGSARLDNFLFLLTFYFLVAVSLGGTGSITGVLLGTGVVVFIRQYGDPLEQSYPLTGWVMAIGVIFLIALVATLIYRNNKRLRPRVNLPIYILLGLAALSFLAVLLAPQFGWLEGDFRGFGMRAIFLSVILIVIMIFRPAGLLGQGEFSWAGLMNERRDKPTAEERAQDAWLSNPELNKTAKVISDSPAERPQAHPLIDPIKGKFDKGEK